MTEPAERQSSAPSRCVRDADPPDGSLARQVAGLPWICPAAASLARLAHSPAPAAWPFLRCDPGAVLLLLRSSLPAPGLPFPESLLHSPAPLQTALRRLEGPPTGLINWSSFPAVKLHDGCLTLARLARALALRSRTCDPEQAWCAALLAPLGWLGVCAVAPSRVADCLGDPAHHRCVLETQERHWCTDHGALARRLASGWELPDWLAGVIGRLDLPVAHARRFSAPPALFSLVRLAACLAREQGVEFGLIGAATLAEDESTAGIRVSGLAAEDLLAESPALASLLWEDPYPQPLLRQLLEVARDNRVLRQTSVVVRLEREADELHSALREQVRSESERLQSARLLALAELAAGAGHEINNPLAVISGQAQYLLAHEADFFAADLDGVTRKALSTIIAQTKRIHGILRDLMQFARPAQPRPTWIDLPTLLGEVAASLTDLAGHKRVRVEVIAPATRLAVHIDADQVRTALSCLLRNAIEAAPAEGWARIGLAEPEGERIEVFVEDSGPGVAPEQRVHLFDPFYSGRSAGRGRGMGLPVAWRLARQQGGDLRHEPGRPGAPTRFVLVLARPATDPPRDERQAA